MNPGNQKYLEISRYSPNAIRNSHEGCRKDDVEHLQLGPVVDLAQWTGCWSVGTVVEGLVQSDSGQTGGPDTESGVNKEVAGETGETVPDEICTKCSEDLVAKLSGIRLIEVAKSQRRLERWQSEGSHWQILGDDDVGSVWRVETNGSHNGDKHVLLLVEWTRVERELCAKHFEALVR